MTFTVSNGKIGSIVLSDRGGGSFEYNIVSPAVVAYKASKASVEMSPGSKYPKLKSAWSFRHAPIACSTGNDRFAPVAEFEGNEERWRAQFHAPLILHRLGSRNCADLIEQWRI